MAREEQNSSVSVPSPSQPSHSPVVQADVSTVSPAARVVRPHTSVHLRAPFPTKPCGRLYPALVDFFDLTWNRDARDCQGLLTHDGQQTPFQIFRPSKPFWNLDAPCQEESKIEEAVLQNPPPLLVRLSLREHPCMTGIPSSQLLPEHCGILGPKAQTRGAFPTYTT